MPDHTEAAAVPADTPGRLSDGDDAGGCPSGGAQSGYGERGRRDGEQHEAVSARFDSVRAVQRASDSVLTVDDLDQAALRALLTLFWDTGHEVLRLTSTPEPARARAEVPSAHGLRATAAQPYTL
jgi:hypothetical protein